MTKLFDPISLMNENVAANATRRDPLPIGETVAQITKMEFSEGTVRKPGPNQGKPWNRLDLTLEITDAEYLASVPGTPEKVVTNLGVMLDLQNGTIATGPNKNIRLGRLRAATETNGKPLAMMDGCYIRIAIGHKPHPTEVDEEGNPVILDEIISYTKV